MSGGCSGTVGQPQLHILEAQWTALRDPNPFPACLHTTRHEQSKPRYPLKGLAHFGSIVVVSLGNPSPGVGIPTLDLGPWE